MVLVVDSRPEQRRLLGFLVRKAGANPIFAEDGASALRLAHELHPALVLLELVLPDMPGLDVIRALQRQPPTSDIPVIAVTGRAMEGDRESALRAGCARFVPKPFDVRDMVAQICAVRRTPGARAAG